MLQGPVTAEAVFQNNEEVRVYQVYSVSPETVGPGHLTTRSSHAGRCCKQDPIHDCELPQQLSAWAAACCRL